MPRCTLAYRAHDMHATLESMNESQSVSPARDNLDDMPLRSSTDIPEVSPPEADAGPNPIADQTIPAPSGLDGSKRSQPGALASLLLKISATPVEVMRALEELRALIDERVLGAIGAFRTVVMARMDAHDATSKARMDAHGATSAARLDVLDEKVDALRREIRLILLGITLVLTVLGALAYLGLTNRLSARDASTPNTTQQVAAPVAQTGEPSTTPSNPALDAASTGLKVAGSTGHAATTDCSRHSRDTGQFLAARRTAELAGSRSVSP